MSAKPAETLAEDTSVDAEVTGIVAELLEEHGSETAALRALAHDFIVLLADADGPYHVDICAAFFRRASDRSESPSGESRCLVPFKSFSEFNREAGGDIGLRSARTGRRVFSPGYGRRSGQAFGRREQAKR